MPDYKVKLMRTSTETCEVEVMAKNPEEAQERAIDDFIGDHDWETQETLEIKSYEWEEIEYDPTLYCTHCGAKTRKQCDCGPIPEND